MFANFLGKRSLWLSPNSSNPDIPPAMDSNSISMASSASWPPNYIILTYTYTPAIYRQTTYCQVQILPIQIPHQQWTQTLLHLTMASLASWPPNYIILTCTHTPAIYRQICMLSSPNSSNPDTAQYLHIYALLSLFIRMQHRLYWCLLTFLGQINLVKSKFFWSRYPHQQWTQTLLELTMASSGSWPPNYIILTCTYTPAIDRQICILSSPNSSDPDTAQYLHIALLSLFIGLRGRLC